MYTKVKDVCGCLDDDDDGEKEEPTELLPGFFTHDAQLNHPEGEKNEEEEEEALTREMERPPPPKRKKKPPDRYYGKSDHTSHRPFFSTKKKETRQSSLFLLFSENVGSVAADCASRTVDTDRSERLTRGIRFFRELIDDEVGSFFLLPASHHHFPPFFMLVHLAGLSGEQAQ